MSQRVYRIRKAFLVPLGVDSFLLLCLLILSLLPRGSTTERLVFALFFFPSLYLFLECFFRRVTLDDGGITVTKLGRIKSVPWEGITHIGALTLRKKAYLMLTTVRGFFIVSNAYEGFSELTEGIVSRIDPAKVEVEEEVRLQAGRSPSGIAHIVMAWIAALFMVGILLIKMAPAS